MYSRRSPHRQGRRRGVGRGTDEGGKRLRRCLAFAVALLLAAGPAAAEVVVLSGGAVEPGVLAAAEAFRRASGAAVAVRFATAPAIRRRVEEGGEAADVLVVPAALAEELARAGRASGEGRTPLGRVGVGVAVREGDDPPDMRTPESFRGAVLAAEELVFNTASTGLYLDALFERMGLAEAIRPRAVRHPTGDAVLEDLRRGGAGRRRIGFGAVTEILLHRGKGVVLAGPLPAELQNSTLYVALPAARSAGGAEAAAFLSFLGTPEGLSAFRAAGIEE